MIWNFKKGNLLHILTYLTLNQLPFHITVCSIKEVAKSNLGNTLQEPNRSSVIILRSGFRFLL